MTKRALITGILGQDGAYLARLLHREGFEVWGTTRKKEPNLDNLRALAVDQSIKVVCLDLMDETSTKNILKEIKPDHIYNLAAPSSVADSFNHPAESVKSVAVGALNLLEAITEIVPESRYYQASSSEMFGNNKSSYQDEQTPFSPESPYAVAKVCAHSMTVIYRKQHDLFTACGILFNHESPLRSVNYVSRKITNSLARHARGQEGVLRLGNIDVSRDFGFSGDYVRAMYLMLMHNKADDYVVATGESNSVRNFANTAMDYLELNYEWIGSGVEEQCLNRKTGKPIIEIDPNLYRPIEVTVTRGDFGKASRELNWKPKIDFKSLVALMVDAEK